MKRNKVTQKGAQNKLKRIYKGCEFACKGHNIVFEGRKSASGVPQMARPGRERSWRGQKGAFRGCESHNVRVHLE